MTTPQEPTQMTAREMLELAALAAEIAIYFDEDGDCYRVKASGNRRYWNPIDFDGDALRLAVKLKMFLDLESCNAASSANHAPVWFGGGEDEHAGIAHDECDPCAAARLAITRAAAEIGRQMKEKQ